MPRATCPCARVEWRREHDGYYPRDTYRDLMHYCGGRCSLQVDIRCFESFVDCLLVESNSTLVEASSEYSKKKLSRISLTPPPQENTLVISEVRPEDKGVYRCYREGGDQKEFAEVDVDNVDNVDMPTVVMRTLWCLGNILPQVPAVFQRRLLTMMTRHSAEISYE